MYSELILIRASLQAGFDSKSFQYGVRETRTLLDNDGYRMTKFKVNYASLFYDLAGHRFTRPKGIVQYSSTLVNFAFNHEYQLEGLTQLPVW